MLSFQSGARRIGPDALLPGYYDADRLIGE
jgi:hypothetical protein